MIFSRAHLVSWIATLSLVQAQSNHDFCRSESDCEILICSKGGSAVCKAAGMGQSSGYFCFSNHQVYRTDRLSDFVNVLPVVLALCPRVTSHLILSPLLLRLHQLQVLFTNLRRSHIHRSPRKFSSFSMNHGWC
jgi:hypothetical protein